MRHSTTIFIAVLSLLAFHPVDARAGEASAFACERPAFSFDIPDGASSTRDEMLALKDAVEVFVRRGEMYLDCLSSRMDEVRRRIEAAMTNENGALDAAAEEYRSMVRDHDEVVAEMQRLADEFNRALESYNQS